MCQIILFELFEGELRLFRTGNNLGMMQVKKKKETAGTTIFKRYLRLDII